MNTLIENARVLALFDIRPDKQIILLSCQQHRQGTEITMAHGARPTQTQYGFRGAPCLCQPEVVHLNFWEIPSATKARDVLAGFDLPYLSGTIDVLDTALATATRWHCGAGCNLGLAVTFDFPKHFAVFDMPHDDDCSKPTPVDAEGKPWSRDGLIPVIPAHGRKSN